MTDRNPIGCSVEQSHAAWPTRTRTCHQVSINTAETLKTRRNGCTMRKLAVELGYPENYATTLSHIIRMTPGCVTTAGENRLRSILGLAPLPEPFMIAPCPSCSGVHVAGDCGGKPVAAVVTLAPGEVVTQRNGNGRKCKPAPPCFRPRLALDKSVRREQLLKLLEECK